MRGSAERKATFLAVVLAAAPVYAGDVSDLLGRHGIRAVQPSPASNFELPAPGGDRIALADARGRWVLLTFFATWCGPCRTEMPSLEKLHRSHGPRGLDVLGVAIDGPERAVQRFVDGLGVTFPVVVDGDGEVATRYHASSVPVSYLIDPRGHVVGVARGARDWAAMSGLFDGLLAAQPPDPSAEGVYTEANRPVELPSTLVPPSATVTTSTAEPRPGVPFSVDVRITWAGHFEDYLLHPPTVHLPDSVRELGTSASTSSTDGGSIVTYQIELEPSEAGSFALDPVELRYTPRGEQEPVATRIPGPTVTVAGANLPLAVWIGVGVLVLAAGLGMMFWRRSATPAPPPTPADDAASLFDEARKQRLDGDIAAFLVTAQRVARLLDMEDVALDEAIERARFGGQMPPREQLDQLQRRLERQLAARSGDPDAPERDSIRLANPKGDES